MREIRQICLYIPNIKDKYYVSDDGAVFVRNEFSRRVLVDGVKHNIKPWCKNALEVMQDRKGYTLIPGFAGQYVLLSDGSLLKRLKTSLFSGDGKPRPVVGVYTVADERYVRQVAHFVGRCFLDDAVGKEIHHINNDPMDNSIDNLRAVSREEHHAEHGWRFNDHPEREYAQAGGSTERP